MSTSLRTPDEPMAFTSAERNRGALWTWLVFVALLDAAFVTPFIIGVATGGAALGPSAVFLLVITLIVTVVGGAISGLITLAALPLAGLVGRALRKVRARWVHTFVYAVLGGAVGGGVGLVYGFMQDSGRTFATTPFLPIAFALAALTAIAATTGWWITMHRALHEDQPIPARP